jgi:hypothetical protein
MTISTLDGSNYIVYRTLSSLGLLGVLGDPGLKPPYQFH